MNKRNFSVFEDFDGLQNFPVECLVEKSLSLAHSIKMKQKLQKLKVIPTFR